MTYRLANQRQFGTKRELFWESKLESRLSINALGIEAIFKHIKTAVEI